jgi:hypothetical protein
MTMASVDTQTALLLVKTRLNRTANDTTLDEYFQARINAAIGELEATGIALTASTEDLLLVVDYAVWQYQNRDTPGSMPEWLRLRRRERWVQQGVKA